MPTEQDNHDFLKMVKAIHHTFKHFFAHYARIVHDIVVRIRNHFKVDFLSVRERKPCTSSDCFLLFLSLSQGWDKSVNQ